MAAPVVVGTFRNLVVLYKEIVMRTTLTEQGRTRVPAQIRKDYQLRTPMQLEWIDDGETIRVVPVSPDPIRAAKGRTKGLYQRLMKERKWERRRA